ncbi:MAG: sialate O-acetylesterase [Parabacteroides sp.]|nr:sialate O-acetylesterase [Parabacteroides sp.]
MNKSFKKLILLLMLLTGITGTFAADNYYCVFKNGFIKQYYLASEIDSVKQTSKTVNFYKGGQVESVDICLIDSVVFRTTIVTDLSAAGYANCYVVPQAGEYSFETRLSDNSLKTGDAADYLWTNVECVWTEVVNDHTEITTAVNPMDAEYIIKNVAYDAQNHRIMFTATGNTGNAVIALYTENAGVRTIVWSWHIWVTGESIDGITVANWQSEKLATNGQSITWLNRNLGATSIDAVDNIGNYGLMYQWGRKDPFIGSRVVGLSASPINDTAPFGTYSMPVKTNEAFGSGFITSNSLPTVEASAQSPMTFFTNDTKWASDIPVSAWGDGIATFAKWSQWANNTDPKENNSDGIRSGSKTIYDPCPAGFRMPTAEEIYLSFVFWKDGTHTDWDNNIANPAKSTRTNGRRMITADPNTWTRIPACGWLDNGKVMSLGSTTFYWSATINPENQSQAMRYLMGSNCRIEGSGTFAFARPVRCVADKSLEAIPDFTSHSSVSVDANLQSNMVLQQNAVFKVSGTGTPTEKIRVAASWEPVFHDVTAGSNGRWSVDLNIPAATNIPQTIKIQGKTTAVFDNILIGEVWLCSGQSNMRWNLKDCNNGAEEVAYSTNPNIRLLLITGDSSTVKKEAITEKWKLCTPTNTNTFSAVSYFFGRELQKRLSNIPIGLITSAVGATPVEVWIDKPLIENDPELKAASMLHSTTQGNGYEKAGVYYNRMIYPLKNIPIGGAIWYQGESNQGSPYIYEKYLQAMVISWRNEWNSQFPFYIAQIAPYKSQGTYPTNYSNPALRFVQTQTSESIALSGIEVNDDLITDVNNIHPTNKQDVGLRLAYLALSAKFGKSQYNAFRCPIYDSFSVSGNKLTVQFKYAEAGLKTTDGTAPTLFEICGDDHVFYPANAVITGSTIELSNPGVTAPVASRMGWSYTKVTNLRSGNDMPVSAFRTYDWTDTTEEVQ